MTDNTTNNTETTADTARGNFEMKMPEGYDAAENHHTRLGIILAILIIVLVIIFGGLYLWGRMLGSEAVAPAPIVNDEPETPRAAADATILDTTSPSDDLDAINADLESTNLESIDADLTAIDGELQ
ncbi:MAG TPA: hypothetical protein VFS75_03300 [Candidatus Paceibacterota bacterium]|nr:hypothetical protein [Candidatus Paceibacterota bacterium]